jgi:RNA polymerase sigma-70 factor (ECF subfamily)
MLARRVGVQHIELVEDAVQCALMAALTAWTQQCVPEDPGGWLYKVAHNKLIQDLRRASGRLKILEDAAGDLSEGASHPVDPLFSEEIRDDMLRMLFVCCHEDVPWESRLVLALKTLCGFSTPEIAMRLFTSEANVHKRLARARDRLRETMPDVESPPLDKLESRLSSVHSVLYLLFNEGYLSAHAEQTIRRELCEEAIRLTMLLTQHTVGATPQTFALLALMHLHMARLGSRVDATGGLLLLEEQDRSAWEVDRIYTGLQWLQRSATGDVFSRYHAEAGIAAEHCLAPSYRQTRWQEIDDLYARLERSAPSPLHTLNRAVAIAEWRGPQAALALLDGVEVPAGLCGSYLWDAVLADLHRRAGHSELSQHHRQRALGSAPTHAVRELLRRRLAAPD